MHDLMLENKRLDRESLVGYARDLGLDVSRFERELDSQKYLARVEKDVLLARELDLYQTPTFVINGRLLVGFRTLENLRQIIDEELAGK